MLAVGSPFGDDAVGWAAARALREHPGFRAGLAEQVSVVECDRPGMALVELIAGAGFVVLLDAVVDGGVPGRVLRIDSIDALAATGPCSSHGLGLAESLRMAAALGELDAAWVVLGASIEPAAAASSQGALSAATARAAERLACCALDELRAALART